MEASMEKNVANILSTAVKVITNPVDFFRNMPKTGGFPEPIVFMAAMGVVAGVIHAIFSMIGVVHSTSFVMAALAIIWVPIVVVLFSFVGAAIIFVIWKIMGSRESYETAYRCTAYAGVIVPITGVLNIIPYLGPIIGSAWSMALMVFASIEVHKIKPKTAWIVFGVIFGLLTLTSTCSQYAARKAYQGMGALQQKTKDMTPEEAGRAMGEFLKGVEKAKEQK